MEKQKWKWLRKSRWRVEVQNDRISVAVWACRKNIVKIKSFFHLMRTSCNARDSPGLFPSIKGSTLNLNGNISNRETLSCKFLQRLHLTTNVSTIDPFTKTHTTQSHHFLWLIWLGCFFATQEKSLSMVKINVLVMMCVTSSASAPGPTFLRFFACC